MAINVEQFDAAMEDLLRKHGITLAIVVWKNDCDLAIRTLATDGVVEQIGADILSKAVEQAVDDSQQEIFDAVMAATGR